MKKESIPIQTFVVESLDRIYYQPDLREERSLGDDSGRMRLRSACCKSDLVKVQYSVKLKGIIVFCGICDRPGIVIMVGEKFREGLEIFI